MGNAETFPLRQSITFLQRFVKEGIKGRGWRRYGVVQEKRVFKLRSQGARKPNICSQDLLPRIDLIWELHTELLGHLIRVKWVRCCVLLVEKVNLDNY